MTPQEIHTELKNIIVCLGPKAEVYLSIDASSPRDCLVRVSCYPNGITGRHCVAANAETFGQAIDRLRNAVAGEIAQIHENRIREMSLAIMEITFDVGSCSDAALRGKGFAQSEIDTLGEMSITRANSIAGRGPFSITKASTNLPPEHADFVRRERRGEAAIAER